MPHNLRILNEEGRRRWRQWIEDLRRSSSLPVPTELLSDPLTSSDPPKHVAIPDGHFESKFNMAAQILPAIVEMEAARLSDTEWPGVWDALALLYFDDICPLVGGIRKVKASERYCFTSDYRKTHRHRIWGPISFYQVGRESAKIFLSSGPDLLSDQEEQIGSRQEISSSNALLEAISLLYWKKSANIALRGWATNRPRPGTLRRFVSVVGQLSRTFDLQATHAEAVLKLLPKEFKAWRIKAES